MYRLTCAGTPGGAGLVLRNPGSIGMNRNAVRGRESTATGTTPSLISLSLIWVNEAGQRTHTRLFSSRRCVIVSASPERSFFSSHNPLQGWGNVSAAAPFNASHQQ